MGRRAHRLPLDIEILQGRIRAKFEGTPLHEVGERLLSFVQGAALAVGTGSAPSNQLRKCAAFIEHVFSRLPNSFGDRFAFDALLIHSIVQKWRDCGARMSSFIVPVYAAQWQYEKLDMPSEDQNSAHAIRLIHFPGKDLIDSIDLLEYPWLIHELGHDLFYRNQTSFDAEFSAALTNGLGRMRLRGIADRGRASSVTRGRIDRIEQFWKPTPNHQDWSHELAIDMVGLWACGPAYIDCFCDVVGSPEIDPVQVSPGHPPYKVRASGIMMGAAALGWSNGLQRLTTLLRTMAKADRDNFAIAAADDEIVRACVECGLRACREVGLPKCDAATLDRILTQIVDGTEADPSAELIIAAWLLHKERGEEVLSKWEQQTIRRIGDDVEIMQ